MDLSSKIRPSFLGFDFSTQQIKCVCTDYDLEVLQSFGVSFDADLPKYKTDGGVNTEVDSQGNERVYAMTEMWIEALDLLFQRMTPVVDFSQVRGLSGCGQMHGTVYWADACHGTLENLDPSVDLFSQLRNCFACGKSPVWVDSSTWKECAELEAAVGGTQAMADVTGSKAYERFSGPQIRYMYKHHSDVYRNTSRISIVSSFACSLFLGKVAPIDLGDGSGTNLLDIHTLTWSPTLLDACAPELLSRLQDPVDPYANVGSISAYWVKRYGFPVECAVAAFTGDNCASVEGLRAQSGDLAVSCGTSDNLIFLGKDLKPNVYGHLFISSLESAPFFVNLCYKNGSLMREEFKKLYCQSSWDVFESMLDSTPVGNEGFIGLFYSKPEHIPQNGHGIFMRNPSDETIGDMEPKYKVRALLESQFLMKRVHLERLAGFANLNASPRILITGGASRNRALCQIIANVYNGNVYFLDIPNAAALGNAYRAKFCLGANSDYESMFGKQSGAFKLVAVPDASAVSVYNKMLPRFKALEQTLFGTDI